MTNFTTKSTFLNSPDFTPPCFPSPFLCIRMLLRQSTSLTMDDRRLKIIIRLIRVGFRVSMIIGTDFEWRKNRIQGTNIFVAVRMDYWHWISLFEGVKSVEGLSVQLRVVLATENDSKSMTAWIPSWLPFPTTASVFFKVNAITSKSFATLNFVWHIRDICIEAIPSSTIIN